MKRKITPHNPGQIEKRILLQLPCLPRPEIGKQLFFWHHRCLILSFLFSGARFEFPELRNKTEITFNTSKHEISFKVCEEIVRIQKRGDYKPMRCLFTSKNGKCTSDNKTSCLCPEENRPQLYRYVLQDDPSVSGTYKWSFTSQPPCKRSLNIRFISKFKKCV